MAVLEKKRKNCLRNASRAEERLGGHRVEQMGFDCCEDPKSRSKKQRKEIPPHNTNQPQTKNVSTGGKRVVGERQREAKTLLMSELRSTQKGGKVALKKSCIS